MYSLLLLIFLSQVVLLGSRGIIGTRDGLLTALLVARNETIVLNPIPSHYEQNSVYTRHFVLTHLVCMYTYYVYVCTVCGMFNVQPV